MNITQVKNKELTASGILTSVNMPSNDVYRTMNINEVLDVLLNTLAGCDHRWCRLIVTNCSAMTYAMLATRKYVKKCPSQSKSGNHLR